MSGGIDSSVAAALLKRAGFDLIGVFMKFWSESKENDLVKNRNKRCSLEAETRARKIANMLKIPFYVFNFEKEFKDKVVNYFLRESAVGLTPNPCVVCNKEIKFGLLLKKALTLNANYVATGHYVRISRTKNKKSKTLYKLLRAKDKNKDQSYFLWQLSQKQLRYILFPIGEYTKTQVRFLAKKFKLPVFKTKESQEICFVQNTVEKFLKKYLKQKPGKIIDTKGKILGRHQGLFFYTIGQRKGLNLSGGPYYVLEKDSKKNVLIVTKNENDLYKKELIARAINWISGKPPKLPIKVKVKIRYRHQLSQAVIKLLNQKTLKVFFNKPQRAITPGQSIVFYKGEELLGGGIIAA